MNSCPKCVLTSHEAPDLVVSNGSCNYCKEWERREQERKIEASNLPWVYENMRSNGKYDCLLGLSGGVDSSMCLHYLKENGIRPLCFSVDNGYNSEEADLNIMKMVETLKVPFERIVLNLDMFHDLQAAFLMSGTKNQEIPTDHVLLATSYNLANKYGIKTIVGGGNHATEGIMPENFGYDARDLRFIKDVYRKHKKRKLEGIPTISFARYCWLRFFKGIKTVNLLDYYEYDREKSVELLGREYGYKPYGEKHMESKYTWWFQSFYLPEIWGLDKRRAHFSSLINSGQMTREKAMEKLLDKLEYPIFNIERRLRKYPKRDYTEYKNSHAFRKLMERAYANIRRY